VVVLESDSNRKVYLWPVMVRDLAIKYLRMISIPYTLSL